MTRTTVTLSAAALLAAASCTDLLGPEPPPPATVTLSVIRDPGSASFDGTSEPVARIRLTTRRADDRSAVTSKIVPAAQGVTEWQVQYTFTPPSDGEAIVVTVELLGATGQLAMWSGATSSFTPASGDGNAPIAIAVYPGPLDNLGVINLSVTPDGQGVDEGSTIPLSANIIAASPGAVIFWRSLDPAIATVNNRGIVTGVNRGVARIVAAAGPQSDTAGVTVRPRVASIVLSPAAQTLASLGSTATFTARALDQYGADVPGVAFTYSVSPATVATQVSAGTVRSEGNGTAIVQATARGVSGTATLTVAQVATSVQIAPSALLIPAVGESAVLAAQVRDANGRAITSAPVAWTTSAPGIASVAQGVVTAAASGIATITASAGAASGNATVTVGAATLFSDGFESGFSWIASSLANRTRGGQILNAAHPVYVTAAGSPVLPVAPQGQHYLWFGYPSTGNYLGPQAPADEPGSGGLSQDPQAGTASSQPFAVPHGAGDVYLTFRSWFEIEGFRPSMYDRMRAAVIDVGSGETVASLFLNAGLTSSGSARIPRTSAGAAAPPVFVTQVLPVVNVAGKTLRIEFTFDTEDEEHNGFRGWIIDDVRVTTAPPAPPALH